MDVLAKSAVIIGGVAVVILVVVLVSWFSQPEAAAVVEPPDGTKSGPGWEIRYNATLALAQRGSTQTRLDLLAEMLDLDQLRRSARKPLADGQDAPDEATVTATTIGALSAIATLHRKNPDMDLAALRPAIEQLQDNPNPAIRLEARKTLTVLDGK
ncbi:MAG: hypothetical protein ACK4RK_10845 [Gemmataceae bacterium]